METDFSNRKATATIFGLALVFAAVFWVVDTGSTFWTSDSGLFGALVPSSNEFLMRVLYALLFAGAGWVTGTALQRSREIEQTARDRLTAANRKYWALLASSFDGMLIVDQDMRIVDASDLAATMFGSDSASLIGSPLDQFIEIDDPQCDPADRSISKRLRDTHGELECCTPVRVHGQQGRVVPAEVRVSLMPEGQDSVFLVAIRDTTSALVAQKTQQHAERRFQALFENIPGGVYRGSVDGRLLAANPALAQMLGYDSVDELLATADSESIFLDVQERKALATELERHGKARNFEIRLHRRDGTEVPVLANIQAVGQTGRDGMTYEGVLTDISDLQETREAMLDREEYFRELCENSLDVITVIDQGGIIRYSSPSSKTLSSRSPEEQVGLSLLRDVHPDDIERVEQIIVEGFERPGTAQHFTCRLVNQNGTVRTVDSVGTAFMTRKGHLRAVIHSREVSDSTDPFGTKRAADDPASNDAAASSDEALCHE